MKRRSATSSAPPREPLTYFVDRNLGVHEVARALEHVGARVELHRDHFPDVTPDIEWIPHVAKRGWVILTQDRAIQRHPHERAVVMASRAWYFCVSGGSRRGVETAQMIADHFSVIDGIARAMPPPLVARVTQTGLRYLDPNGEWLSAPRRKLR